MLPRSHAFAPAIPLLLLAATAAAQTADWPQWRGPQRNGTAERSPALRDSWPEGGPKELWTSEATIPSDDYGGHGSPVVVGDRVYLALVWHRDVPSETRCIDHLVLRKLGYQRVTLPADLVAKIEEARVSRSARLRGRKLNDWADGWIAKHLDEEQRFRWAGWVKRRLRLGKTAIGVADLERVAKARDRVFPTDTELQEWVDAQEFSEAVRQRVLDAVPATKRVADDVVLCMDATTGKTLWKKALPGEPTGRRSSSTPCVHGGKIYVVGSTRIFCLDASTGKRRWETPAGRGAASSPLVHDGVVIALLGRLTGFDAESGEQLWQRREVRGRNSSPALWHHDGGALVICNASGGLAAVEPKSGRLVWRTKGGGGDSTPAIAGDLAAVYTKQADAALAVYRLGADGATRLWARSIKTRRYCASPLLHGGQVFLFGGGKQLCVDLESGDERWAQRRNSELSSPVLADGKIFAIHTGGRFVSMIRAAGDAYEELARAKLGVMRCPSPAIAGGRLYLRRKDRLACFDLR